MPAVARLASIATHRIEPRPLAFARIIAGLAALVMAIEEFAKLWLTLQPGILPTPYVPGIPRLSQDLVVPFMAIWFIQSIAFMIGWKTRVSGVILASMLGYVLLMDEQVYSNHLYLMTLLVWLLVVADSGQAFSIDARRGGGRESVAAWPALLIKLQLTIVYGFAALSKVNVDYLSGSVIEAHLRTSGPLVIPEAWHGTPVIAGIAIASVLTEGFLAVAFWSPRLRAVAVLTGIGFHTMILVTMSPQAVIGLFAFALAMFVAYPLFFELSWLWKWFEGRAARRQAALTSSPPPLNSPLAD